MPLRNPKAKGARFERKSKALLESQGFMVVKSGGSLGEADLIAIRSGEVQLVQVKSGTNRMTKKEKASLAKLADGIGCTAVLHQWKDRVKDPVVEILNPFVYFNTSTTAPKPKPDPTSKHILPAFQCNHANEVPIQLVCNCLEWCQCKKLGNCEKQYLSLEDLTRR